MSEPFAVPCAHCKTLIPPKCTHCPNCGHVVEGTNISRSKGGKRRYGWKWCPKCQSNRLKRLWIHTPDDKYDHVECKHCIICGTELEDIPSLEENNEGGPLCPTCNNVSRKLKIMSVSLTGKPSMLMQVFQCTNRGCLMEIPYPEDGTRWRTEFVIDKNGSKHTVRPSASEFS